MKARVRQWRIWARHVDRAAVTPEQIIESAKMPKIQEARIALGMMGKKGWKIEIRERAGSRSR